jgi:hypothetical protein
MNEVTVFKIRIDSISSLKIGFELFSGDRVKDTYVNVLSQGSYGSKARILLTPRQFTDFATRLIAYVYTTKGNLTNEELKVLWELKLNIFDHEAQQLSNSIFNREKSRMVKLGLVKRKEK